MIGLIFKDYYLNRKTLLPFGAMGLAYSSLMIVASFFMRTMESPINAQFISMTNTMLIFLCTISVQEIMAQSDLDFLRTDISVRGSYTYDAAMFYIGTTYSPGISVTALVGGMYRDVLIGYAYEIYTGSLGYLNGSHDLMVKWQTEVDFFKKGKNVHKSVRYL